MFKLSKTPPPLSKLPGGGGGGAVVRKMDKSIHWMNNYPKGSAIGFRTTYPLDSDLSGGHPTFEQPGPVSRI